MRRVVAERGDTLREFGAIDVARVVLIPFLEEIEDAQEVLCQEVVQLHGDIALAALELPAANHPGDPIAAALELHRRAQSERLLAAGLWPQLGVQLDIVDQPRVVAV